MSNRQARIARKRAQRGGTDAYVHLRPTEATRPYETAEQAKQRRRDERKARELVIASGHALHRSLTAGADR